MCGGSEWYVGLDLSNWTESKTQCSALGMELADINNRREQDCAESNLDNLASRYAWLDMKYFGADADFRWATGMRHVYYQMWGPKEPRLIGSDDGLVENCGSLADGGWYARPCKFRTQYLCKKGRFSFNVLSGFFQRFVRFSSFFVCSISSDLLDFFLCQCHYELWLSLQPSC